VLGHTSTELRHLRRELGHGVHNRLVAENLVGGGTAQAGEMDLFALRGELVVAVHKAEEVQDHARVTHVQAKSEIRARHRDAPALRSGLGLTATGCPAVTIGIGRNCRGVGDRCGITGLTIKNHRGHLLGEVAKSRLVTVPVVLVTAVIHRSPRGLHGSRRRDKRPDHLGRRRGDQSGHVRVVVLIVVRRGAAPLGRMRVRTVAVQRGRASPTGSTIGDGKTRSVRHDGVAVCVIREERVRGRESRRKGRSVAEECRRHFVEGL
jgi:hypothetical protein